MCDSGKVFFLLECTLTKNKTNKKKRQKRAWNFSLASLKGPTHKSQDLLLFLLFYFRFFFFMYFLMKIKDIYKWIYKYIIDYYLKSSVDILLKRQKDICSTWFNSLFQSLSQCSVSCCQNCRTAKPCLICLLVFFKLGFTQTQTQRFAAFGQSEKRNNRIQWEPRPGPSGGGRTQAFLIVQP